MELIKRYVETEQGVTLSTEDAQIIDGLGLDPKDNSYLYAGFESRDAEEVIEWFLGEGWPFDEAPDDAIRNAVRRWAGL